MSTTFFTILLQQILNSRLLQDVIDSKKKKKKFSGRLKQKTRSNLTLKICYEKYCECNTSKKKKKKKESNTHKKS